MESEIAKIIELTGVERSNIKLMDDGFWSRGYVIDNGRIVFKFKKSPEVSYRPEIRMLNFINSLSLDINLQKVQWVSPNDEYLGVYGVIGKSLEATEYSTENVGKQLGTFLKKLHESNLENAEVLDLESEIKAWQERFSNSDSQLALSRFFTDAEMIFLNNYMYHEVPEHLKSLGERLVLSHGDLGDGNIFVDDNNKVGVIDFNETCYLDEAADFMDVSNDELCEAMLNSYGADATLRNKVIIRRQLRPLIVFGNYAKRGDDRRLNALAQQIKTTILAS